MKQILHYCKLIEFDILCTLQIIIFLSSQLLNNLKRSKLMHLKQDSPSPIVQQSFSTSSLDLQDEKEVYKLVQYVKQLQVSPSSLKTVRKLLIQYGLAIMIYLKPFYQKLQKQGTEPFSQTLKKISAIAKQMIQYQTIPQISFIFAYETDEKSKKTIKKQEIQIQFIEFIKKLSEVNKQILGGNASIQVQKYNKLIEQQIATHKYNKLMLNFIQQFRLHPEQFPIHQTQMKQNPINISSEAKNCYSFSLEKSTIDQLNKSNQAEQVCNNSTQAPERQNSIFLCCRKYFIEQERIRQRENSRTSFLNISFPYNKTEQVEIKRIICSFLNEQGGILYLGIQKGRNGKQTVKLNYYTESQKQQILKTFRRLAQSFDPNIIIQKLYSVEFVPIRSRNQFQFIPGANVTKIRVNYGIRNQFYSFEEKQNQHFTFRNGEQIIEKNGRQLLKSFRSIINNPLAVPIPIHTSPCQKPDIGQPLHTAKQKKELQKKYGQSNFKKSQNVQSMRQVRNLSISTSTCATQKDKEKLNKPLIKMGQSQMDLHECFTGRKNQNNTQDYTFFFSVGLQAEHLAPIFTKKNILNNVKMESASNERLVIKVMGNHQAQIARKVFKKLLEKYSHKIKIMQVKLVLQLNEKFNQALQCLKKIKAKFKIFQNNKIKFQTFRQSLSAYLLLQDEKFNANFTEV